MIVRLCDTYATATNVKRVCTVSVAVHRLASASNSGWANRTRVNPIVNAWVSASLPGSRSARTNHGAAATPMSDAQVTATATTAASASTTRRWSASASRTKTGTSAAVRAPPATNVTSVSGKRAAA